MNAICIISKYPETGNVKSRLGKEIGDDTALSVYKKILFELVSEHRNADYDLFVCFSPSEKKEKFKKMLNLSNMFPSKGNDLGKIMSNALSHLFKKYDKVILIGADTPQISTDDINRSFVVLDSNDIVIGPAFDGGYYLIGMKESLPVFTNISWSTEKVLDQTISKLEGISYSLLENRPDIDTLTDLKYYQQKGWGKEFTILL